MNFYLSNLYNNIKAKYNNEPEYVDAIYEFLNSINHLVENDSNIEKLAIVERLIEPDRIISFKVPWVDDNGKVFVNKGYRVQFSNLIGPYKGGIRFHPTVNESVLKFLAFEQTLKNALTGLPLGGAKGGADFDPVGKSDFEIMRFTQSYMMELYKYLGPNKDIPAGDIGVSKKEVGYMYQTYKKLTGVHDGSFTGKHVSYGGSLARTESTGYGVCYIASEALNTHFNSSLNKKSVIVSGSGQVGIHAAYKAKELGANVIAMSAISGVVYDKSGIDILLVDNLLKNKLSIKDYLKTYPKATYYSDVKELWKIKADVVIPCATQNEIDENDAKALIANKIELLVEGANKPTTNKATRLLLDNNILIIPSKAANAGGVATSGLEMQQNATHSKWTFNEVDNKLKTIMSNIYSEINNYAKNNNTNLIDAANLAAFKTLYEAMKNQGI